MLPCKSAVGSAEELGDRTTLVILDVTGFYGREGFHCFSGWGQFLTCTAFMVMGQGGAPQQRSVFTAS